MTLPESSWVRYINRLSAINKTAARKFEAYLNTHDVMSKSGRKAALDYAAALVMKYGEGAAAVSCEMYDAVAAASGAILPAAEPAAVASYGEVAKTINGIMKTSQNASYIASGVERLVKQAGADTTLMNARRDGAEFAWVPHGDTCSFCVMLASNGWQTASKKTIKGDHAEHIHANCDCTFAIRFDGKSGVEGYDPDKLREIYDNAEGDTWQEKLNSMRRDEYAANADKIRAQKREAYDRRKNLKSEIDSDILRAAEKSRRNPGSDEKALVADLVGTKAYLEKMRKLGEPESISNVIAHQARVTLWRRNGTAFEDLIYIDPSSGKVLAQRGINIERAVGPTEKMKKLVQTKPREIIAIHNHPHSNLPSFDDLESAKFYRYGVVICHNGSIVKYSVKDGANLELADKILNYAQDRLNNSESIEMELNMLKDIGVEMEVFL